MSTLVLSDLNFGQMTHESIHKVQELEKDILQQDQVPIDTHHLIHAGMYARTIMVPAGVVLTGALIKKATTLVISGKVAVWANDQEYDLEGYHVIPASPQRKQAFAAIEDTYVTMIFATDARTVRDAEDEFTDEGDKLMSRRDPSANTIIVTGD